MTQPPSHPAVSSVHAVLAGYLMHWHRLAVDASLFIATGSLTIAGFTLTAAELDARRGAVAIALLLIIALGGGFISRAVHNQVRVLRGLIQKIDEENGVFEPGFLRSGEPLYPPAWRVAREEMWSDPITTLTTFAAVVLPLAMAAAIFAYVLLFPSG